MEILNNFFQVIDMEALATTLLHSLWQGGIVAILYFITIHISTSPKLKSFLGIVSLGIMLLAAVITYTIQTQDSLASAIINVEEGIEQVMFANESPIFSNTPQWEYWISITWCAGVMLFLVKFFFSLFYVRYISVGKANPTLSYTLQKLRASIRFNSDTKILESARISSPVVVGYLKPIILCPVGMVTHLTTEEIEGIIAHEVAHIARHDYLLNGIQVIIEALFFYHPAVWWISNTVRKYREESCDDIALSLGISPLLYAKAIMKIQELEHQNNVPRLAMALGRDKHQLLNRIKRILNMKQQTSLGMKNGSLLTLLMVGAIVIFSSQLVGKEAPTGEVKTSITPLSIDLDQIEQSRKGNTSLLKLRNTPIDTIPETKSSISITTNKNGKTMQLKQEDGKITELKIDGREIPESEYDNYKDMTDDLIIINGSGRNHFFFGNGMGDSTIFKSFDFDQMFDDSRINEMLENLSDENMFAFPEMHRFENFNFNFDGEDMEEFEEKMKELGGRFEEYRFDTLFNFGPGDFPDGFQKMFRLELDDEGNGFRWEGFDDEDVYRWKHDGGTGHFGSNGSNKVVDVLGKELNRDGLLEPFKENSVVLTGKYLKINGDKQPKNIWGKYKRIYEDHTGTMMSSKSRIDFRVEGKKSNRKIRSF